MEYRKYIFLSQHTYPQSYKKYLNSHSNLLTAEFIV